MTDKQIACDYLARRVGEIKMAPDGDIERLYAMEEGTLGRGRLDQIGEHVNAMLENIVEALQRGARGEHRGKL